MNPQRETFPSAAEASFLVIGLYAIEYLVSALLHDVRALSGIDPNSVGGAIAVLANGVLFSVLMHYKGLSYASLFHASKTSVAAIVGVLSIPILCIVPALALTVDTIESVLVDLLPMSRGEVAMFEQMTSQGVVSMVTVCILSPVLEEMLFRGVILRSFLHQYRRWPSILGCAVLFGLAHLNLYQFFAGLIVGTLLGWLYERTRSLWPPIILHAAYNSTSMTIPFANEPGGAMIGGQASMAVWGVAFALAFGGSLILQRLLGGGVKLPE